MHSNNRKFMKCHDKRDKDKQVVDRLKFRLRYIGENISDSTAIRFGLEAEDWEIDKAIKEIANAASQGREANSQGTPNKPLTHDAEHGSMSP